ncbi:unnamed protein product [Cuscuta campestris]|uniref:CCHC-type domain-containing protein n=2 Tax=Cuscuta campestris TaxID=132261 RepID=A0A484N6K6_9ASTE|nr:unnamed protein product [Cuscuta campestris]
MRAHETLNESSDGAQRHTECTSSAQLGNDDQLNSNPKLEFPATVLNIECSISNGLRIRHRGFPWQQNEFRSSKGNLFGFHGGAVLTAALRIKCGGCHHDLLLDAELDLWDGPSTHSRARNHGGLPSIASATTVNFRPNAGFNAPVNPFVGPHWASNGPFFLHTPNAVGPISVPASTVQRPPKFNGTNFKMSQQNMTFFLTVLGFTEYLHQDPPHPNNGNDPLVAMVNQAWYHNNYLTINYILEGLGETLYPVYVEAKLAKELWSNLKKKYQAEDAGTKKFIVRKMLDYKTVDNKSVVAQAEELMLRIREEGRARRGGGAKANVVEHPSGSSHGGKDKKKIGPKGGVSKFAGKCYYCGITGHHSSHCRKKKPQKNKKKTTEAMCTELDNLDLCAVVTKIKETATPSYISSSMPSGIGSRFICLITYGQQKKTTLSAQH